VQAAVVMFSLLFVMLNLLVDIVYTMIDPRVRLN
jgi:ABC-type dipeptide/oligopeptide/nickel transport system permease component